MTTTIRQCAILAGGLGSRLGGLTSAMPKPLLPCGDRPFLAWLMREFMRFGVTDFLLLTGHLSDVVEQTLAKLQARLPFPVRITLSAEPSPAGTAGALFHAREQLDDRFLLANGDSLFDCNLARLLTDAVADTPSSIGRLLLRPSPGGTRFSTVRLLGDQVVGFDAFGGEGPIHAGLGVFRRSLLDWIEPLGSLESDVFPLLAAEGALHGTVAAGYFRDIGVPADYAHAKAEIPRLLNRRALFLDRDGVLNVDHGYVGTRDRFSWTDGALDAIRMATDAGWHVFIVTNQSGVARGFYTEADVQGLLAWMVDEARAAGGTIDDMRFCPYHPDAKIEAYRQAHPWRKPEPGMLLDLIQAWSLDPAGAMMIGDQPTDLAAAQTAGIAGHLFPGGNLTEYLRPLLNPVP